MTQGPRRTGLDKSAGRDADISFVSDGHDRLAGEEPVESEFHLRAVIERQPVALARVARDGTLLAVNETGLPMLGAQSLEQILGTSLAALAVPEQREPLEAFLNVLDIRASRHPGAPDGIHSSLLVFHDVTAMRRLEDAAEAAARRVKDEASPTREEWDDLRARHEALQQEKRDLAAEAALLRVEATYHRQAGNEQSSRLEALETSRAQALETADGLQAALDQRDAQIAELTERRAEDEQRQAVGAASELKETVEAHAARLAELGEQHAARIRDLESAHAVRISSLEQTLAEEQLAHERREAAFQHAAASAGTRSEVAALTVQIAQLEAAQAARASELAATHAARLAALQQTLIDEQTAHDQRVRELEQAAAARMAEAEQLHAEVVARNDALAAESRRAEEAFIAERRRLDEALQAARASDREAREALAAALTAQAESERRRTDLVQAIARLAHDAAPAHSLASAEAN
jgi:hypothetical protein